MRNFLRGSKSNSSRYSFMYFYMLSMPKNFSYLSVILLLLTGLFGCSGSSTISPVENNSDSDRLRSDSQLTFFGVSLEQFDQDGKPFWKVQAREAKYTKEKEIGQAKNPQGELYQDGQVVYTIKAETADIQQDGKQLVLKGKIVARDPRNGVVLEGNELEWRPQEDLLIVRNQFNGRHRQLKATAQEARVKTRQQQVEFTGQVFAISNDPKLQIKTERLLWQVQSEKLVGDRPVEIQRYQNNQFTDRGQGQGIEVNLKTKITTLGPEAKLQLINPTMQINSNAIAWDINQEIVKSNVPVRVIHQGENIRVAGNKAEMKLPEKTVYLTGDVKAIGQRNQYLKSERLTWYLERKLVEAQGKVIYHQMEPPLTFQGSTAIGNLATENIIVKGGSSQVVTEVIPQQVITPSLGER